MILWAEIDAAQIHTVPLHTTSCEGTGTPGMWSQDGRPPAHGLRAPDHGRDCGIQLLLQRALPHDHLAQEHSSPVTAPHM